MKIYDNISEIVKDDMESTITKGSKVSVAAAYFSMYAYKELKKQLNSVDELYQLYAKIRKEKQLNRQIQMNSELKLLKKELEEI